MTVSSRLQMTGFFNPMGLKTFLKRVIILSRIPLITNLKEKMEADEGSIKS